MTPLGQHADAGLGPCPNDPPRRGLNSSTPHRCFLQFAAVRQYSFGLKYGAAFFRIAFCVLENGCRLPSCGLCAAVGWVGAPKFCSTGLLTRDPALCWQWCLSPFAETSWCWGARRRGDGVFLHCFRPRVDHPSCAVGQHADAG